MKIEYYCEQISKLPLHPSQMPLNLLIKKNKIKKSTTSLRSLQSIFPKAQDVTTTRGPCPPLGNANPSPTGCWRFEELHKRRGARRDKGAWSASSKGCPIVTRTSHEERREPTDVRWKSRETVDSYRESRGERKLMRAAFCSISSTPAGRAQKARARSGAGD